MGFSSAGRDQGSTFYFELPLYNAVYIGLDPEQAARTMLLSQNRLASTLVAERTTSILSVRLHNEDGSSEASAGAGGVVNIAQTGAIESESTNEVGLKENSPVTTTPRRSPATTATIFSDLDIIPPATTATTTSTMIYPGESIVCDEPKPVRFLLVDDSAMNRKVMARIISGEQRGRLAVT
eukprot:gene41304-54742_t